MKTKTPLMPKQKTALAVMVACIAILAFWVFYGLTTGNTPTQAQAWFLLLLCIVSGEAASAATKAFIPGMFVSSVLAIVGFWTIIPKNILEIGGISTSLTSFLVVIIVVHMGTMLSPKELIAQWRTILITVAGMLGICLVCLTVGQLILDRETVAIAAPPLTGGFVAALMMKQTASAMGNEYLGLLAIAVYILQGFAGFPLTNICLRKESARVLKLYRSGEITMADIMKSNGTMAAKEEKAKLIPPMPAAYHSAAMTMIKIILLVLVAEICDTATGGVASKYVVGLVLGVVAAQVGFLETKPLERAHCMGFIMILIMLGVFTALSNVSVQMLLYIVRDFVILLALSVAGIALLSIPLGKKLGWSVPMSFAIGLSSLAGGFPASYVLSDEAAKLLAENEEEYKILAAHLIPKTLVAGFASATSGSVFVASIVISIFFH